MGAGYNFSMVLCVAWCCISVALSAAIPGRDEPLDPDHVPSSVCETMYPAHKDHTESLDSPPYTLTPSKTTVSPGETITVMVSGNEGAVFRGIYLQARVLDSGPEAVGKFSLDNQLTNPAIRVSSCPPGSENAISYVSRDPLDSLIFEWKVPETTTGKIYFRSTIVQTFSLFWINVDSVAVTISESA